MATADLPDSDAEDNGQGRKHLLMLIIVFYNLLFHATSTSKIRLLQTFQQLAAVVQRHRSTEKLFVGWCCCQLILCGLAEVS